MELKNQNILFISKTMGLGGTENVVLQLCEILKPIVNNIVVASSGGVNEQVIKKLGIKHYIISDITNKNPKNILNVYISLKDIIKNENITIIHSHHRMAAFYSQFISDKNIIKIANAHNTFYDKKLLTRLAYRNVNLIAVGNKVKENLVDYFGIASNHVTVIHNAVKGFTNDIVVIDALQQAKKEGKYLIGNIGRLSEQKGMSYFIDAAKLVINKYQNVLFFIIGDGELRQELIEQVKKNKLERFIYFLGYRSDIQNVISQLDFVVLSSLWEGLPLTPIEAYSVGKTVIGTKVDGTAEIIQNNIDGILVEPKNSTLIAEKIMYLIQNPKIKHNLDIMAKKRYDKDFSFDILKQNYIDFYRRLVHENEAQ